MGVAMSWHDAFNLLPGIKFDEPRRKFVYENVISLRKLRKKKAEKSKDREREREEGKNRDGELESTLPVIMPH